MALPKKIKKHLSLVPTKVGKERREELLEEVTNDGTFLPKGVLHADLDRGALDFVKQKLKLVVDGKLIPTVDKIITNQSWSQFTETWKFQDLDKNVSLPFIITVREPNVKYGKIFGGQANIPDRLRFSYYTVPTWNGERKGADVYKIPQPVPVDISYSVKIFCSRMREVNEFNKIMMQTFTSKQAYVEIKGHFMPLKMEDPSDESVKDIEKRKYYIQTYKITLMGFLLDEKEFQVSPAVTRQVSMFEVDTLNKSKRTNIEPPRPDNFDLDLLFVSGNTQLNEVFRYNADLIIDSVTNLTNCYNVNYTSTTNNTLTYVNCSGTTVSDVTMSGSQGSVCVKSSTSPYFAVPSGGTINTTSSCSSSYSVFINNNYLGDNLPTIQISNGDVLKIIVYKDDPNQESIIKTRAFLV
jgi:hypothetical protein